MIITIQYNKTLIVLGSRTSESIIELSIKFIHVVQYCKELSKGSYEPLLWYKHEYVEPTVCKFSRNPFIFGLQFFSSNLAPRFNKRETICKDFFILWCTVRKICKH